MFPEAAKSLKENSEEISNYIGNWVKNVYPSRTLETEKCARDIAYILRALVHCLNDGDTFAIDEMAKMFYTYGHRQLKTVNVEFEAYSKILDTIREKELMDKPAYSHCYECISRLKEKLTKRKLKKFSASYVPVSQ
jgi:hypothetical protein